MCWQKLIDFINGYGFYLQTLTKNFIWYLFCWRSFYHATIDLRRFLNDSSIHFILFEEDNEILLEIVFGILCWLNMNLEQGA